MTYELLDGTMNVIRFPVEDRARPTIELMRDIRPDVRALSANAEAFGFEQPVTALRLLADRETACHIEASLSQSELPSAEFVAGLLEPLVLRAVTASRDAIKASRDTEAAQVLANAAVVNGHSDAEWLQQRADAAALRMVEMGLIAHSFAEEAEGAARAIGLARQGVTWTPRSSAAESDEWMETLEARSRREA